METFKKTNNEKCVLKAKKKIECLADSSKSREERVEECVRFYEKYKYILEPENRDSFFYITFNDCKIILILVLRHYIGRNKISIPVYYEEPTEERYKQINCILKQDSFRENVYKVFSSQIIQYYYQNNDQHTKQIIESYNSFCNNLKDLNFRDDFFDKQILSIPKQYVRSYKLCGNREIIR